MVTASRPGLRERKKQRTRDALLHAALELFLAQGYERTTVDEITETVDVSQRTFFRYFAGKEEAVFFAQSVMESHFVEAVRQRPPLEAPLEALRQATLEVWDGLGEVVGQIIPAELHLHTCRLIESTPALLATQLRRSAELEEELARVIAEREGLDVDTDPRPRVAVAVFCGALRVTKRLWSCGDDTSPASIRELTVRYLDAVRPTLAEKWRTE
ncbi:TetR family transcriptional regulator [Streptomyces colonosanans]|uniref:TetR family transcriptional regulator n=1 Tax=Streptomyces colonosanans TaxID=1428652 RepID=A0A1S2NZ87_9ACTN|nr:TetR family transcriptional regulator [Streptomyces colonosanans]OIJ86204.1 TetR family transcriptional regulator [Streptomyces colonosanans]